jgi:hypothetical protein
MLQLLLCAHPLYLLGPCSVLAAAGCWYTMLRSIVHLLQPLRLTKVQVGKASSCLGGTHHGTRVLCTSSLGQP